ncbi:MAG: SRPBCC family protein [Solirubrobacterales bacterium]
MRIHREIPVRRPAREVFEFMRDFTTTEQWDPGTVSTDRISGDGGVGTRYLNVSRFLGRETELVYELIAEQPGSELLLRGTNDTVVAEDRISVRPVDDSSSVVTYDARFSFSGIVRLVVPLAAPAFKRLGDRAATRLAEVLS